MWLMSIVPRSRVLALTRFWSDLPPQSHEKGTPGSVPQQTWKLNSSAASEHQVAKVAR